jgi:hypothetical protein
MSNALAGGIYVVMVQKDGKVEILGRRDNSGSRRRRRRKALAAWMDRNPDRAPPDCATRCEAQNAAEYRAETI